MATYYGANCVYIVFMSESMHGVINYAFDIKWDIRIYIAMMMVPVILIGQVWVVGQIEININTKILTKHFLADSVFTVFGTFLSFGKSYDCHYFWHHTVLHV